MRCLVVGIVAFAEDPVSIALTKIKRPLGWKKLHENKANAFLYQYFMPSGAFYAFKVAQETIWYPNQY